MYISAYLDNSSFVLKEKCMESIKTTLNDLYLQLILKSWYFFSHC